MYPQSKKQNKIPHLQQPKKEVQPCDVKCEKWWQSKDTKYSVIDVWCISFHSPARHSEETDDQSLRIFTDILQLGKWCPCDTSWKLYKPLLHLAQSKKVCHPLEYCAELGKWIDPYRYGIFPWVAWKWAGEDLQEPQKWWLTFPQKALYSPSVWVSQSPIFWNPQVPERMDRNNIQPWNWSSG